jgi:DNA polymerase-1
MQHNETDNRLFLLDAYALIFRAYYAFIKSPRINSKGLNTSAIFGFTNTLLEILEKEHPSHIAVVFDHKSPTFREQEYAAYKANRDETPEDIKLSEPFIRRIISAFRIPILEAPGYEADDVIGTLAQRAAAVGYTVYMMTPDKDFGQLVTDKIFMYKPARSGNGAEIWGPAEVCARFDIQHPHQVIDLLGMMGDAVDNIPGIPGIGEKTAAKLIGLYGSMEGLYENVNALKGKQKENIIQFRDQAFLSKKLATILTDAPVPFEPDALIMEPIDKSALREVFAELEFRRLSERVLGETIAVATARQGAQMDLFGGETPSVNLTVEVAEMPASTNIEILSAQEGFHEYHLTDTPEKIKSLLQIISFQKVFCFDTETTGTDAVNAEVVGMSFSVSAYEGFYVPIPENFDAACRQIALFRSLLEDPEKVKIGQNVKYDILVLKKYGIEVSGPFSDTMIAHYLLEPDNRRHSMDYLAETYLNYRPIPISDLIGEKGKQQGSMRDLPPSAVVDYAAEDADITLRLHRKFLPMLKEASLNEVYQRVECPLIAVLADMEFEGIKVDVSVLQKMSLTLGEDIARTEKEIFASAGVTFNIASPKQVGEVLFDRLKLDAQAKKTKTGQYMTNEETISRLSGKHPVIDLILDYRELQKLKGTYVDALPKMINEKDGRIHTSFNQIVAATGRLSSDNPNLQNIPIRTARGREIRRAFIPRTPNHVLLSADYSQIELRVVASMSGDPAMTDAFNKGKDIHTATAARVFGVPEERVTKEQRYKAKSVNFGIIYGQGAFGLAQNLNISRAEAREIIESYKREFQGITTFMDQTIADARETGYVQTLMGRRRRLPDINSANQVVRAQAERNAINAPIQGTAADMIKLAMIKIHGLLREGKFATRMILQVHDELIFDVPAKELDTVRPIIEEAMINALPLSVPVLVESGVGSNWLEAH